MRYNRDLAIEFLTIPQPDENNDIAFVDDKAAGGGKGEWMFWNESDYPQPYNKAQCGDCGWIGDPDNLTSDAWQSFQYCPQCGSDETDIITYKYNDEELEYEPIITAEGREE